MTAALWAERKQTLELLRHSISTPVLPTHRGSRCHSSKISPAPELASQTAGGWVASHTSSQHVAPFLPGLNGCSPCETCIRRETTNHIVPVQ
jgi:hypothetical protein